LIFIQGSWTTFAFIGTLAIAGTPSLIRNERFQPDWRACRSPRSRSTPRPSGAPVSKMS
jgi:hypothetical protein